MKSLLTIILLGFIAIYLVATATLYIRCLAHLRKGYKMYLWNPAWIFDRESVEEHGQQYRKRLILLALIFPVIAFSAISLIEQL